MSYVNNKWTPAQLQHQLQSDALTDEDFKQKE